MVPSSASPDTAADDRRGWTAVGFLAVASMVGYFDRSLLSLLVEPVRADLGISGTQMSLLLGFAFAVFMGAASLPIAWLADRYDRVKLLAIGIALWSVMTGAGAFAESFGMLFLSRIGVGVGEAVLVPVGASLVAELLPRDKLARANAVGVVGTAVGVGLALVIGGELIRWIGEGGLQHAGLLEGFRGWQTAFLLAALPGLPLAALALVLIKDPRAAVRAGARLPVQGPAAPDAPSWRAFVRANRTTLAALWVAYPLVIATIQGWLAWTPTFLIQEFSVDPARAGWAFGGALVVFGIPGALAGGILTDRSFARGGGGAAIRVSIVAALALAVCGGLAPFAGALMPTVALIGAYFFFVNAMMIMPLLAMQLITPPPLRARMAAGLLLMQTVVGGGIGPTLVAALSEKAFGSMHGLGPSLAIVSATICPLAALLLFAVRHRFARSIAQSTA